MEKTLLILVFVTGLSGAFAQEKQADFEILQPTEYREQISNKDVQLVDVRTPEEYAAGHIEGAENINFYNDDLLEQFEKFDKEKPLYLYCRTGNRSGQAAEKLSKMGFETIFDLKGGYPAWEELQKKD